MTKTLNGIAFDPGFGPYIMAFTGSVEYLYADINRFKNFSQKKMKFMQYYKKILDIFNNNLGFYVGCLMWAAYIKTQPEQKLLSNHCLGQEYNEEINISETQFMLNFTKLFSKDMKYFLGQDFSFDNSIVKLIEIYEEFLIINKGFVEAELNTDIKLPESIKIEQVDKFKTQIDEVIKMQDLSRLLEYLPTII